MTQTPPACSLRQQPPPPTEPLPPTAKTRQQGYAFSYPLARLLGSAVVAYVHYPMISTDMLGRVRGREVAFNNRAIVARSSLLSGLKVYYYQALAWVYGAGIPARIGRVVQHAEPASQLVQNETEWAASWRQEKGDPFVLSR